MAIQLEQEFQEPYENWRASPSPETTGKLLRAVNPIISSALRTYAGPSARNTNVKSQAKRMAAEAFSTYDPTRASMKTHLMSRLQRLRRESARQRQIIRIPEQVAMEKMQTDAATKELEEKLGKLPSDQQIADYTGLSLKRLGYIRGGGGRPVASGTFSKNTQGEAAYDPAVKSLYEQDDPWAEFIYDDLDETNQFIMERALGMHGHTPMRPTNIAQLLKVSPAAVSLRMRQIQQKLDRRDELEML